MIAYLALFLAQKPGAKGARIGVPRWRTVYSIVLPTAIGVILTGVVIAGVALLCFALGLVLGLRFLG